MTFKLGTSEEQFKLAGEERQTSIGSLSTGMGPGWEEHSRQTGEKGTLLRNKKEQVWLEYGTGVSGQEEVGPGRRNQGLGHNGPR